MKKFNLLVMILATVLMVACNNSQNSVQEGGEENVEATETVVDSSKAAVKERQEANPNIKKTASRPNASKRGNFRLEDNSDNIYAGEFAYMADAAYFINCSTD
ncbi:MAG: hypothetical protein DWQ02_01440, partial [Bacteroidetes bacterium]